MGPTGFRIKASKAMRQIYVSCVHDSNIYSTACGKLTSCKSGISVEWSYIADRLYLFTITDGSTRQATCLKFVRQRISRRWDNRRNLTFSGSMRYWYLLHDFFKPLSAFGIPSPTLSLFFLGGRAGNPFFSGR